MSSTVQVEVPRILHISSLHLDDIFNFVYTRKIMKVTYLSWTSWYKVRYITIHLRVVEEVSVPASMKSSIQLIRSGSVKSSFLFISVKYESTKSLGFALSRVLLWSAICFDRNLLIKLYISTFSSYFVNFGNLFNILRGTRVIFMWHIAIVFTDSTIFWSSLFFSLNLVPATSCHKMLMIGMLKSVPRWKSSPSVGSRDGKKVSDLPKLSRY